MALLSPGVQVTVIDQSNYIPAATNSVPFILLATASNKVSGAGTGIAAGTTAATVNQTYLITSQRDLLSTYGVPFFYNTAAGTPINGYELNEYGLLAAYSALGVTNQCYVQRVDVDLSQLTASLTRPTGSPPNGTYWLDTVNTQWGIFEWNQVTGAFTNQVPLVITSTADLETSSTVPLQSFGSIGNYAVTATSTTLPGYYKRGGPTSAQTSATELSDYYNTWVLVGSDDWKTAWPTVQGTLAPSSLTAGNTITINGTTVAVPAGPNNTVTGLSNAINSAAITGVYSAYVGGKLELYANSTATSDGSTEGTGVINITASTGTVLTNLGITATTYAAPAYLASPNYTAPNWRSTAPQPEPTGSVWQKINNVNLGTNIVIKRYNSTLGAFVAQACPVFYNDNLAIYGLDPSGGGTNIPAGTTYAEVDPYSTLISGNGGTSGFLILERYTTGATVITGTDTTPGPFVTSNSFTINATQPGTTTRITATATLLGTTAADFVSAVSAAGVPYVSASINSSGALVFTHSTGGDINLTNVSGTPVASAGFSTSCVGVRYRNVTDTTLILSNWVGYPTFTYTASNTAPNQDPATGQLWYYSAVDQADIMVNDNGHWVGYQNANPDVRGYDLSLTNATGPQFSPTAPTTQNNSAASPLQYGDLWIDTSDLELYPVINRWQSVSGVDQWVTLSNADQTTENGILFADARWAPNGITNPVSDPIPSIVSLLTSNYLDPDAPNPSLYPQGMLLWNSRRSGFNVKSFEADAWNVSAYPAYDWSSTTAYAIGDRVIYSNIVYVCEIANTNQTPTTSSTYWSEITNNNTWNTASGNRIDGSPYMGRQAQRALIVQALGAGIDANTTIRQNQNVFNLIACPQYPELAPNMVALNDDRNDTAFVIVDTPLRLSPADVITWATNNNGVGIVTGDGLLTNSTYSGAFYPSCRTTDLSGNTVVQPPSHMMVRTIIRSDSVSYPWLAPAGTRRGVVDNAFSLGYINAATGEYVPDTINQGLRDILYQNNINPVTFIPGVGITNFGNHTLQGTATALDRINVARLVAYLRGRLQQIGNNYLFEPNDAVTRAQITNSVTSLMIDLVNKRGIYDYLVVCDLSNNTPATIDANELYVDIAIEPVKAIEFIYIPLRIQNTGTIAAQTTA
jgi:hypothetical protein